MSDEPCVRCRVPSVLYQRYSGRHLCAVHLAADILVRVKRTIRLDGGLGKRSVIAVEWDGCSCPSVLSILVQVVGTRPGMELVLVQNGSAIRDICDRLPHFPFPVRVRTEDIQGRDIRDVVQMIGADRLIRCMTLDEEAEQVLESLLSGGCSSLLHKPVLLPVILLRPFREIPLDELRLITPDAHLPALRTGDERSDVQTFLSSLIRNHPSVPFSLIRYRDRLCDLEKTRR